MLLKFTENLLLPWLEDNIEKIGSLKKKQKEMYVDRVEGYFVSPSFSFSIQSSSSVSCFLFFFMALYLPKALLEKI